MVKDFGNVVRTEMIKRTLAAHKRTGTEWRKIYAY